MSEHPDEHDGDVEPDDPTGDDEPTGEGERSLAAAAAEDGSQEVAKKLTTATTNYHKRIETILGQSMEDAICPTCDGFGFADAAQVEASASGMPDDVVHPAELVTCERCNGYGEVITGSKNPAHATTVCTACAGNGYINRPQPVANVAPLGNGYTPPVAAPAIPEGGVGGQFVPGRGFIPYGATEPIPNTAG